VIPAFANSISGARMNDPALELECVCAGYGETRVLENVTLRMAAGERVALIGRNGVGKTTMMATIMGLTKVHEGSIRLNGENITRMPTYRRSMRGLGLVPQTRNIFPSLSVEENVRCALRGDATVEEAYALFPRLKERRQNGGTQLSGGEQQMLAVARTLMARPTVLLLDEPLEGLAPIIREMLMQAFKRLAAGRRHTIVLVEQHVGIALEFADRAVLLDKGTIVFDGPAKELKGDVDKLQRHVGLNIVGNRALAFDG
jgi:branched-chain amino acid transport system ATP-binding protein